MHFTEEDEIVRIISKRLTGNISPDEKELLDEWAGRSRANMELAEQFMSGEGHRDYLQAVGGIDHDAAMESIMAKRREKKLRAEILRAGNRRRRSIYGITAAAAGVAVILALFFPRTPVTTDDAAVLSHYNALLTMDGSEPVYIAGEGGGMEWKEAAEAVADVSMVRLEVPRGSEYKAVLSDGTTVWLNSDSSIEYPAEFGPGRREVKITGEVYFEVVRQDGREFRVSAGETGISVLGTSFNVAHYDGTTVTTLVSGSVNVATPASNVHLIPGQQAVADTEGGITVSEVDTELYASWTRGVFEFEDMPLERIARQLERWYDVKFVFEGSAGSKHFTGGTWKYVPLDEFLSKIGRVADVDFVYEGDVIVVR